jgi:hypothetical protein
LSKKITSTSRGEAVVEEAVAMAEQYLRANPWLAVAGTAVATHIFSALTPKTPIRRGSSRAAVRDWLDDAYENLPSRKQLESAAKSAGVPTSLSQLQAKLTGE